MKSKKFSPAFAAFMQEQTYLFACEKAPQVFQCKPLWNESPEEKFQALQNELFVVQHLSDEQVPTYLNDQKKKEKKELKHWQKLQEEFDEFKQISGAYWQEKQVNDSANLEGRMSYRLQCEISKRTPQKTPRGFFHQTYKTPAMWRDTTSGILLESVNRAQSLMNLVNAVDALANKVAPV